ncbi:retrovirus-related pol polyprotein LINE-1 [Tanacetum coccineum]
MACSLPHTIDEIQPLVQKLMDEDIVRQKAIMELAVQFDNASTTKDNLRKAYEKCNNIPQESRALIDTFLKQEYHKDYEMKLAMIEAVDNDGHLRSCPSGLGGLFELSDTLGRHKVDIACFQETRWKGSRAREGNGYKLWYSGSSSARNGVGVLVAVRLKDDIVRVTRRSDRIMAISVVIDGEVVNVISAYAPQVGLSDVEKKRLWNELDELVRECSADERLIIGGNLNGHIEATTDEYEGVHGGFANSFFKKSEAHLITIQSGGHYTQIDYLLVRKGDLRACRDYRAFPIETCSSQHRLKLTALEEDMSARNADQMWKTLACVIRYVAKESLGVASKSARTHSTHMESWWFGEERYKVAKKEAKIAVSQAKDKAYEDLYRKLDSKEGANDIYKIAKARERKRMDIGNVRYIKDEGGRTIVREVDIRKRWGEYFSSLFNESPPIESRPERSGDAGSSRHQMHYDFYYSRINQGEVRAALQRMGRNKAVGPYQIPIEAWRCLEDEGVKWLTCLFNKIFLGVKMPDEWRLSEVIPIYKKKRDVQACSNYMGIKLLSLTMKLWERVIEIRLRRETRVSEKQFGFMAGRSTTKAIHLLRSLMEKYKKRQTDLHMAFLDLEKAYDSVPHELLWRTLRDKGTPRRYLRVIKDMYEGGSTISPYLFTLILDELSWGIQESILWCMIFADDIVLIAESAEGLNNRIEKWGEALEDNGLRVSREKMEYLRCDFGRYDVLHQEVNIRIRDRILKPKESFRYLGSMIHRSGRIDEDVAHRIGVGWMKWRAASGVMCDRRIPLKLKGKFYRVAIKPAMLYGLECWPITKAQANKVEMAKLRMLRLRWLGHVKRRPETAPVRRVEAMLVEGSRRRGKLKLRYEDRLKQDMKELLLCEDMTSDRNAWRDKIRISG